MSVLWNNMFSSFSNIRIVELIMDTMPQNDVNAKKKPRFAYLKLSKVLLNIVNYGIVIKFVKCFNWQNIYTHDSTLELYGSLSLIL